MPVAGNACICQAPCHQQKAGMSSLSFMTTGVNVYACVWAQSQADLLSDPSPLATLGAGCGPVPAGTVLEVCLC